MDPTSKGRRYYQEKNYEKALQAFDRAVVISSDNLLLTALDHRAATYEKLGKLGAALKDAKAMIELKPELAKGYLRCAKVLLIKKEDALAKTIYERGLKKVKVGTDTDRQLLQSMYQKLCQKDQPAPCFDPLDKLPLELAQMVCNQLRVNDLAVCLSVSKSWKRFLESCPDLWRTLDLRKGRKHMTKTALKAYLRRSNYEIFHAYLNVSERHPGSLDRMVYVTTHCRRLETLELFNGRVGETLVKAIPVAKNLKSLMLEYCTISFNQVIQILRLCPKLQKAKFNYFSELPDRDCPPFPRMEELREFELKARERPLTSRILEPVFDNMPYYFPNLKSAAIQRMNINSRLDLSLWKGLESLDLTECRVTFTPRLPPTLKHLTLTNMVGRSLDEFATHSDLPVLEYINCAGFEKLRLDDLFLLMEPSLRSGTLRAVYLDKCNAEGIDRRSIETIPTSSSVEVLSLEGIRVSEDMLLIILEKFPHLICVDVSRTLATGVTVKALEEREHGPLEWIALGGCTNLSSDAVEYARAKGTVVELSTWNPKPTWRDRMGF